MKRRVWTIGVFVALLPLLLVGAYGLAGASAAEEGPPPPHAQWRAAVEADLSRYQPTPLEPAPAAAGVEQRPAAPAVSYLQAHERMVFEDARDYNWELYAVDGAGEPVRLTGTGDRDEIHPRLSPDGQRIVFSSDRDRPQYELYTISFYGGDVVRLTDNVNDDVNPDWSPDGTRIVFESYRDGQPEIYVMNADGSGQARLTVFDGYDGQPVWSPDGKWIAFVSTRGGAGARLFRMDPGGGQVQLIPTPGQATYPVWSPDGQSLAFSGDSNGDSWLELWTVNVDGSFPQMRRDVVPGYDNVPRSWVRGMPGSSVSLTSIAYVQYSGFWFWTHAYMFALLMDSMLLPPGDPQLLLAGVDAGWHPDMVSMDNTPPEFALPEQPLLQRYGPSVHLPALPDLYDYEVAWQTYPNGVWGPSKLGETSLQGTPGIAYRARVRAWDQAGNASSWKYTPPLTGYVNQLVSRVLDNREQNISGATIITAPASFTQIFDNDERYHHYTAIDLPLNGAGTITWNHPGFGSHLPGEWSGWAPEGIYEFEVVLPPQDDLLVNGSFDMGTLDGWTVVGGVMGDNFTKFAHFPSWEFGLMTLSQEVTIPLSMPNPTLSYMYQVYAGLPLFRVELTDGASTTTLRALPSTEGSFVHDWVDLSPWAGETVTVSFVRDAGTALPDGSIDDVSVGSALPDVWVRAAEQPAAWRGQTATLRLDYGNRSSLDAPDAEVTWALPGKLTLVSATPAPSGTAPLRWELGTLAAGEEGSIELVVMVKPTVIGGLASAPATVSTPHEAITGNNSTPLGVWVGGKVYLPGVGRD